MTAGALLAQLRAGDVSALELFGWFAARYEQHNGALNAVVATDFDHARQRARAADDARARGESWGPLHGLPLTLKDNIETVHLPTTYGVPRYADYMAAASADVAQLLLDAGAIVFGKTNMPEFGTDTQTFNDLYGQTNNPWDLQRTPGGSSGGAAAALAAGLTPLEIGNDIGGSIRLPAHFCGVYGHKPSYGLVSLRGPKPWELQHADYPYEADLLVNGPLARSAGDLALAMEVITGPVPGYRGTPLSALPRPRSDSLAGFRVGVWLDDPEYPPDGEVAAVLQAFVDRLAATGARIVERRPDISLKRAHQMRNELECATLSHTWPRDVYEQAVQQAQDEAPRDSGALSWAAATTMRYHQWYDLNRERLIVRQQWHDYFRDVDVLLCPVARIAAHAHDHTPLTERMAQVDAGDSPYWPVMGPWNAPALVAWLPATVAPVGLTPAGLPVGVQIVGDYLEDNTPLQFAQLLQRELLGPLRQPPGFEV